MNNIIGETKKLESTSINKQNKDGSSINITIEEIDNGFIMTKCEYDKDYKEIKKSKIYSKEKPIKELGEDDLEENKQMTIKEFAKSFKLMQSY